MRHTHDFGRGFRVSQPQRALSGETLAQFHARETAKPPTVAEIVAWNRADMTVCPVIGDLFAGAGKRRRKAVKALRRRCGVWE